MVGIEGFETVKGLMEKTILELFYPSVIHLFLRKLRERAPLREDRAVVAREVARLRSDPRIHDVEPVAPFVDFVVEGIEPDLAVLEETDLAVAVETVVLAARLRRGPAAAEPGDVAAGAVRLDAVVADFDPPPFGRHDNLAVRVADAGEAVLEEDRQRRLRPDAERFVVGRGSAAFGGEHRLSGRSGFFVLVHIHTCSLPAACGVFNRRPRRA